MRYPEFLKDNGSIGLVAPSFGCNIEPYKSALNNALVKFKDLGYYVNLGENCYKGEGVGISASPRSCANELVSSYVNKENDVLISVGGGELMCEILPNVDFEAVKAASPKWYMGYSDNTNFTFLLTTIADVASIYGPCAGTFGMDKWHESLYDTMSVLTGKKLTAKNYDMYEVESLKDEEHPLASYNCTEKTKIGAYVTNELGIMLTNEARLKGRLIGGCLDCLVNLVGTKYDYVNQFTEKYKDDGIIWYLEACDLNVFDIRRALWHMEEAGWFKHARGFIFGRALHPETMFNLTLDDAELEHTLKKHPETVVITGADIGHVAPMMPIINGSLAAVSYKAGKLDIDMGIELY